MTGGESCTDVGSGVPVQLSEVRHRLALRLPVCLGLDNWKALRSFQKWAGAVPAGSRRAGLHFGCSGDRHCPCPLPAGRSVPGVLTCQPPATT